MGNFLIFPILNFYQRLVIRREDLSHLSNIEFLEGEFRRKPDFDVHRPQLRNQIETGDRTETFGKYTPWNWDAIHSRLWLWLALTAAPELDRPHLK